MNRDEIETQENTGNEDGDEVDSHITETEKIEGEEKPLSKYANPAGKPEEPSEANDISKDEDAENQKVISMNYFLS